MLYNSIFNSNRKKLAVLIDPDKQSNDRLAFVSEKSQNDGADFFLVGGSLVSSGLDDTIEIIKQNSDLPVILFPGSILQISDKADGILLLSLISGRNPDLLIGNHVIAAPFLKKSKLEIISTGYILVDGGNKSSVEYMSNTKPIPFNKPDIAAATAIAGELTGNKLIYLEAGSGAINHVAEEMVKEVKGSINIPLIVGGGFKDVESVEKVCRSGADIIVTGTAFERKPELIKQFSEKIHSF
ncbi:MAG: geranylgeranylglyceryl/heptaprenylglyceryl phosphate synthase [Bacteroidales bacterium]|nr:geranylgeranylglyceryl/heptaprenylglyceryl phosphate synthase [Bacteroidales bacterium]